MWRGGEVESVEEHEKFRDIVMERTNDVCGMRRVGGQRRKRSECWNEEVGRAVAEKRRDFEEFVPKEKSSIHSVVHRVNEGYRA